jgi:hypothetical protein
MVQEHVPGEDRMVLVSDVSWDDDGNFCVAWEKFMAMLTIHEAEQIAQRGRPWTFRMEYHGANSNTQSGVSHKYWYATGRGLTEAIETGHGAIGAVPQHHLIDWTELRAKVAEKLAKGYVYANTTYIRMSAANLAKVTGQTASQSPVVVPQPVAAPVAPPTPPTPVQAVPSPSQPVDPGLVRLGAPYNQIRSLKMTRQGLTITGYVALDVNGAPVLTMNPTEGVDFARKYNVDVVF